MNNSAIIIGFQYSGDNFLPAIRVDIATVFSYVHNILKIPMERIFVITDLPLELGPREQNLRDIPTFERIGNFLNRVKKGGNYFYFGEESSGDDLSRKIRTLCQQTTNLILYYSGHGITLRSSITKAPDSYYVGEKSSEQSILLPKLKCITDENFYSILRSSIRPEMQVFAIVDCCHSGTIFDLDWKLENTTFIEHKKQCDKDDEVCLNTRIQGSVICFSACQNHQKAAATGKGSAFTRAVIYYLRRKTNSRNLFVANICVRGKILNLSDSIVQQKPCITASKNNINLWDWCFGDLTE